MHGVLIPAAVEGASSSLNLFLNAPESTGPWYVDGAFRRSEEPLAASWSALFLFCPVDVWAEAPAEADFLLEGVAPGGPLLTVADLLVGVGAVFDAIGVGFGAPAASSSESRKMGLSAVSPLSGRLTLLNFFAEEDGPASTGRVPAEKPSTVLITS